MGFYRAEWGSDGSSLNFNPKQKFRWLFQIQNITVGDAGSGPLPCIRASRPKLQFREMQAEHLNEVISYPSKPEWQPIQLVLYDRCIGFEHPVMTWLKQQYNPVGSNPSAGCSAWYPCIDPLSFKTCATLILMDGCGTIVESWTLEHCYPQAIDFGELDMGSTDIITADITLRYDRAWQDMPTEPHPLYPTTTCSVCTDPTCDESQEGGSGGITNNGSDSNNGSENQPSNPSQSPSEFPPGPGGVQTNPGFAPRVVMPDFSMI